MSRSPILRSASFMAACLLSLSGCSAVKAVLAGTPSPSPSHAHQSAADQEGDEEPTEGLEANTPVDPLEYGNCTSSDIRDHDDGLTDNDEEDDRTQAEARVTRTTPASDRVDVTGDDLSTDRVVKVPSGARDVIITATSLVAVIKGEIESLTIHGFDNAVWTDAVNKITFGSGDGDNLNYVFWRSRPPQSKVDPRGLNVVGKDAHAPVVRSCTPSHDVSLKDTSGLRHQQSSR